MKIKLLFPIFSIFALMFSCHPEVENFYPVKKPEMAAGIFNKYKTKLDTAYMENNFFEVGIQLANLNAPSDKVFTYLNRGIKADSENCFRVYEFYKLYRENGFRTNIVKADTASFVKSYFLCEEILGKKAFIDYQMNKELAHQERLRNRIKLDSSLFDMPLIEELKQIRTDDQKIRNELSKVGLTKEEKAKLWIKQKRLDEINLRKVEKILENGYPIKEKVSYDHVSTVWLVLHHQGDYAIRQKFLPIIHKAVDNGILGEGMLSTYQWRNELIRLGKETETP